MLAGMNGVIISGDLFNLFVFLEVASISSYALVAFGTRGEEVEAGFKYLILGSLGSLFILFGVGLLYNQTSQLNMAAISMYLADSGMNRAIILALTFFLMGFGLKAAMVPFHAWLPDAHPSAPVPISAMLSSVFVKALGVYALCRILFNVLPGLGSCITVLCALSALSMIVGAALSTAQDDIKRLLAYCTIGQMGLIISVIAVGLHAVVITGDMDLARFALLGALFHLFNHAVFKSLLFLVSGSIEYRLHTRSLALLGGLKRIMPITSGCCRVGALSIAGIPPFSGFFSKVIVLIALFRSPFDWLGIIAVIETGLTLIAFLRLQKLTLEGEPKSMPTISIEPVPYTMRSAMIMLAILCILVGPALPWLRSWLFDPAIRSLMEAAAGYAAHLLSGGFS
jgi:multicomponent Na+:H+ antiporter subunit D